MPIQPPAIRPAVVVPTPVSNQPDAGNVVVNPNVPANNAPVNNAPARGLDAAAAAGTPIAGGLPVGAPVGNAVGGGMKMGIPGLQDFASVLATPSKNRLDLIPNRAPNAVSVVAVLQQMAGTPALAAAVKQMASMVTAQTGVPIPEAMVNAVVANPTRIADLLTMSPAQMRAGFQTLNAANQAKAAKAAKAAAGNGANNAAAGNAASKPDYQLPTKLDFNSFDRSQIKRPQGDLAVLLPSTDPQKPTIMRGDVPSNLDDATVKNNRFAAEIFDRLSSNANVAAGQQKFSVQYQGQNYTTPQAFLAALQKDGHTVEAVLQHRVADFVGMKLKNADGSMLDVPVALMIKTGIKDANGEEAVVPTIHSELVFKIRKGPNTKGAGLDADFKWFQGINGTGFFPADAMRTSPWCGMTQSSHLDAKETARAMDVAATLGEVIKKSAEKQHLAVAGYGITGVCNDTVSVVEKIVKGSVTAYPLMMQDDTLTGEIKRRLSDKTRSDDATLRTLLNTLPQVPSDDKVDNTANSTQKQRILASMPWAAGQEPFACVTDARRICQ